MVKVFQAAGKLKANPACKNPCLDAGTVITEADLQAGLKMYNVTLREADAVFINTGWGDLFAAVPGAERDLQRRRARHQHVGRGSGLHRKKWLPSAPTTGRSR